MFIKSVRMRPQWTQLHKFQPVDLQRGRRFGISVALDDNIAVIGSPGLEANLVYVFEPDNPSSLSSSWNQIAKLTVPLIIEFGYSVAVAGSWVAVGAYEDDTKALDAGAVFVYTKSSSSSSPWTLMARLTAADGADGDNFGTSVAISKDASTIVVGADFDDFNDSITNSGAVYLFRTNSIATTTGTVVWTQVGKFLASDPANNDNLGSSIAIETNIVVVGAGGVDSDRGAVYVVDAGFPPKASPSPSSVPSGLPSFTPSTKPSMKPSQTPSSVPSRSPSVIPSQSPSAMPSGLPSSTPVFVPVHLPLPIQEVHRAKLPCRGVPFGPLSYRDSW
jgi:hypothetical protein